MSSRQILLALTFLMLGVGISRADWLIQKQFRFVRGFRNFYLTAFPGSVGLLDVAASTGINRCALAANGVIDTNDALCSFYSQQGPNNSLGLTFLDTSTCLPVTVKADTRPSPIGTAFQGPGHPIDPSRGYIVNVASGLLDPGHTQQGWLIGPCQPRMPARWIRPDTCHKDIIPNPYDSRLRSADEILCGERSVDWRDDNFDGSPDTCPNGLFDGVHRINVNTWDSDPDTHPESDNLNVVRMVQVIPGGRLSFLGINFDVPPGDAVILQMDYRQQPRLWDPPIDPLACP